MLFNPAESKQASKRRSYMMCASTGIVVVGTMAAILNLSVVCTRSIIHSFIQSNVYHSSNEINHVTVVMERAGQKPCPRGRFGMHASVLVAPP